MMRFIFCIILFQILIGSAYSNSHTGPMTASCACSTSVSLYTDEITAFIFPNQKKNVIASSAVEFPNIESNMLPATYYRYTIDIKNSSIRISFTNNAMGNEADYGPNVAFHFEDIQPVPSSGCPHKIGGINVQTNHPTATWVSTGASFSDHKIRVPFGAPSGVTRWKSNHWIDISLQFACNPPPPPQVKKGMTWGFAGLSDIWYTAGGVSSQACLSGTIRFACETYPVNSPQSNHCNVPYPHSYPSPSHWETSTVDNGTRKCDSVNGDTACSAEKHVLCIADATNPYFNRQPPYHNSSSGQSNYWPNNKPFPYDRPRYKVHAAPAAEGWVDQFVKLSRNPIKGSDLISSTKGDEVCGVGWRMASSHDGQWVQGMGLNTAYGNLWPSAPKQSGDRAFHAPTAPDANIGWGHPGDSGMNAGWRFVRERYWVKSNNGGNCWD